jgi:hypothetical protein
VTYIDELAAGRASLDDMDAYREAWEADESATMGLPEYLGMLWPEYAMWVEDHEVLACIAAARRNQVQLPEYLNSLGDGPAVRQFRALCRRYEAEWDQVKPGASRSPRPPR